MEFRLLGPLQVVGPGGSEVVLASASQRRLVCLLLLRAGTVVSSDWLGSRMGLSPGAVRTSVSRLRRVLGDDTLVTAAPGYELRADSIDVVEFEALLDRARSGLAPGVAVEVLSRALALWRGGAYSEFAHEEWALAESRRLEELRAATTEELAGLRLGLGQHPAAIAELEVLIATEPFRDGPRELLMRALAESGRRVEALRSFQDYRSLLAEEVGTEPCDRIIALDRLIAAGDLHDSSPSRDLPTPLTSFVGREAELATVHELLLGHRLVTLTGAGGCGKSRLALQVAGGHPDAHSGGTWWAELSPVGEPDRVPEAIARAMGLVATTGGASADQVVRRLRDAGPSLLVLDNAEHLLDGVAPVADDLLVRCSDLRVLVTSREPLGLSGEVVWRVPSMSTPDLSSVLGPDALSAFDATGLFLDRLGSSRPDLLVDEKAAPVVAAICARLDGLPLALELAAARARTFRLDWILAGLGSSLSTLDSSSRTPIARHQTLTASIAWSVDLLVEADRAVLLRLSVFRSAFTAAAAAAVGAPEGADPDMMPPVLARLVDKSLVQLDASSGRYRMLETIRQFCQERLGEAVGLDEVMVAYSGWYARWATEVGGGLHGIERAPVLAEMPDLVGAMDWARHHRPLDALRMCAGLASLRSTLGHESNLVATWDWLTTSDFSAEHGPQWARAVAALMASAVAGAGLDIGQLGPEVQGRLPPDDLVARGWLARGKAMVPAFRGDLGPVLHYAQEVVDRDDDLEASVYVGFTAYMLSIAGRLDEADRWIDHLHQVVRRHRTAYTVDTVGNGYAAEVLVAATRGRLADAARHATSGVPRDPAFSMTAACALGQTALLLGDISTFDRALLWSRNGTIALLDFYSVAMELYGLLLEGDLDEAAHAAEQYWAESAAVPVVRVHQRAVLNLALLETGRLAAAERGTAEAAALVEEMDDVPVLHAVLCQAKAQLACCAGRDAELVAEATALQELAERHGYRTMAVDALEFLAVAAALRRSAQEADRLLAAALAERDALGYRLVMVTPRAAYDELVPRWGSPASGERDGAVLR